jgi:hypothetical protein
MRNKNLTKLTYGALILIMALFQFSCRSAYELGYVKAKPMSDSKLYHHLVDSSLMFESFYVKKFSANITIDGIKKGFKGSIKVQKDSLIWMTINAPVGGIEVARLLISKDTVKMINRHPDKTYFIDDFDYLEEKLKMDLNFAIIQSILTNSVFQTPNGEKQKAFVRNFKGKIIDNKYVFISDKARKIDRKLKKDKLKRLARFNYQKFVIDPSLMRITDVHVKDFEEGRNVNIQYRDFKNFGQNKFPQRVSFQVQDSKHLLSCNIKFKTITFDDKLRFSFKISDKYKRIYP